MKASAGRNTLLLFGLMVVNWFGEQSVVLALTGNHHDQYPHHQPPLPCVED